MKMWLRSLGVCAPAFAFFLSASLSSTTHAYVLIADRPENRILKYSDNGGFLGVVVQDAANLGGPGNTSGPSSLALSPDGTKLYVASLNSSVVRYDFNGTTATNPQKYVSNGQSNIIDPGGVIVSPNGATLFVANRAFGFTDSVARLDPNGVSQGADLNGGGFTGRTGLAFDPNGDLLAGTFGTDFMGGGPGGGILRYDAGASSFVPLVPTSQNYAGVATLMRHDDDLYFTASVGPDFAGRIVKVDAATGALDPAFGAGGLVTPLTQFPTGLTQTADGAGFLVSMLTFQVGGTGRIDQYLFDGTRVGEWAVKAASPELGFIEPSALLYVAIPEPSTFAGALVLAGFLIVRRRAGA